MFIDEYRRMGEYDKTILHREQKPVKDARLIAEVSGESGSEQYKVGYSFSDAQGCTRKKTITVV